MKPIKTNAFVQTFVFVIHNGPLQELSRNTRANVRDTDEPPSRSLRLAPMSLLEMIRIYTFTARATMRRHSNGKTVKPRIPAMTSICRCYTPEYKMLIDILAKPRSADFECLHKNRYLLPRLVSDRSRTPAGGPRRKANRLTPGTARSDKYT
ncbi:hypothetical protein EVAR_17072_1 [Eumeta japonica]|uniref:Uncharacterized protein n=1 Tax=Eumeta variegata TaxID=151549 RepID=A0A4C1V6T6_EUMVA|nr:hypothetical protein EVAR_17072_1 [Eumeta japonica]